MDSSQTHKWGQLVQSEVSASRATLFETHTLKSDWWSVYFSRDKETVCFSNPNNFRIIAEIGEGLGIAGITTLAGWLGGPFWWVSGTLALGILMDDHRHSSGTVNSGNNFKKHNLETDDDQKAMTIELNENAISFISPSGRSDTTISCAKANEQKIFPWDLGKPRL
ncbi:hypothetical protein QQS21_000364 [Conoideocrella luteorostrata]|uniref:Up-regulated in Daf-2 domain-containing protein n=1 Tax=Conoideocrella luteorostrata TaxID=1105319 RepID=A0AAJ0D172_9HYPO|nr:hypothetical protein QQS21_000364 [Conoideocrella luteorostrata]